MYLCNASIGLSIFGYVHVNFTDCSTHDVNAESNGESDGLEDNAMGAMQYTVAVFIVYGVAVLGVFGLGINHRRKQRRHQMDHEARNFLKNYDDVRRICEQRSRVGAVNALLRQLHNEPESPEDGTDRSLTKARPSVNSLAFLPISLSIIEENETGLTMLNHYERRRSSYNSNQGTLQDVTSCADDKLKVHKGHKPRTTLGSSRRSYKGCKLCLANNSSTRTRNNCKCILNNTLYEEVAPTSTSSARGKSHADDNNILGTFTMDGTFSVESNV